MTTGNEIILRDGKADDSPAIAALMGELGYQCDERRFLKKR